MEDLKLHGHYPSPFTYRVIWALKLKGIPYEYIEESVFVKKSELLLKYNPVHKKAPVLVHNGQPICESMVIVEYIDEIWPENPLLPADPYERAKARFWVNYLSSKDFAIFRPFVTKGEAQEQAVKELLQILGVIEEEALGDNNGFFGGDKIGFVDIAYGVIAYWVEIIEECGGVKLLDPDQFPRLYSWATKFKEEPLVRENLPDREKTLAFLKKHREFRLASA